MNAQSNIISDELSREIAEIEGVSSAATEYSGVAAWIMAKPLKAKARIASLFSLGGMTVVAAAALIGLAYPKLTNAAWWTIIGVTAVSLFGGLLSLRFIIGNVIRCLFCVGS